jgi:hypothetical protein
LRFERVDNLGAYSIPSETGLLIPSGCANYLMSGAHPFRLVSINRNLSTLRTPSKVAPNPCELRESIDSRS